MYDAILQNEKLCTIYLMAISATTNQMAWVQNFHNDFIN